VSGPGRSGTRRATAVVRRVQGSALLLVLGVLILAGWDKSPEAFLVSISPAWLTSLTTKF
jgi:hypothetical protein